MLIPVGARVGAILGTADMVVNFLGYGHYQGDHIPPEGIAVYNYSLPNPKILLDSGDIVWGCECWWGPERAIKEQLEIYRAKGYMIEKVSIVEARAEAKNVKLDAANEP